MINYNIIALLFLLTINAVYANCPNETGEWQVSGIIKLKSYDDEKIRVECDKIYFLKNSKIIAYNDILIKANLLQGPVNIKTINGRKQSQYNERTKDFINPVKNHSVYIALKDYKIEKYTIDTRGMDGASGVPGKNGKDQEKEIMSPEMGISATQPTNGQNAGDLYIRYDLQFHDENTSLEHTMLVNYLRKGGTRGKVAKGGLGGVYLDGRRGISGNPSSEVSNGASGQFYKYKE